MAQAQLAPHRGPRPDPRPSTPPRAARGLGGAAVLGTVVVGTAFAGSSAEATPAPAAAPAAPAAQPAAPAAPTATAPSVSPGLHAEAPLGLARRCRAGPADRPQRSRCEPGRRRCVRQAHERRSEGLPGIPGPPGRWCRRPGHPRCAQRRRRCRHRRCFGTVRDPPRARATQLDRGHRPLGSRHPLQLGRLLARWLGLLRPGELRLPGRRDRPARAPPARSPTAAPGSRSPRPSRATSWRGPVTSRSTPATARSSMPPAPSSTSSSAASGATRSLRVLPLIITAPSRWPVPHARGVRAIVVRAGVLDAPGASRDLPATAGAIDAPQCGVHSPGIGTPPSPTRRVRPPGTSKIARTLPQHDRGATNIQHLVEEVMLERLTSDVGADDLHILLPRRSVVHGCTASTHIAVHRRDGRIVLDLPRGDGSARTRCRDQAPPYASAVSCSALIGLCSCRVVPRRPEMMTPTGRRGLR